MAAAALIGLPAGVDVALANDATPAATWTIDAHVVANGSSVTSGNACHRLRATIGEPVAGHSTNASHALSAGFRAIAQSRPADELFFAGFEDCP